MLHIADVSEFQRVDWPLYGATHAGVICRVHNGRRADYQAANNLRGARANVRVRGWYQYVVADRDPVAQADAFCATLGALQLGEFVAGDFEEGAGDQNARANAWLARVDANLPTVAWDYSGEAFFKAHLGSLLTDSRPDWVANYRSRQPGVKFALWQHSDNEIHAGVNTPCDCSIFQGTADELVALLNPQPPAQQEALVALNQPACTIVSSPTGKGYYVVAEDGGVFAYGDAAFQGSLGSLKLNAPIVDMALTPKGDGYWMVGRDGGVFAFGAAAFKGSPA